LRNTGTDLYFSNFSNLNLGEFAYCCVCEIKVRVFYVYATLYRRFFYTSLIHTYETWLANRVLRRTGEPKRDTVTQGRRRNSHTEGLKENKITGLCRTYDKT
jgi:hypothetical protein